MTGEGGDFKKGQNLETIISKLSKDQPEGIRSNFLLISGIDCSNVMLHMGSSNEVDDDEEPDLFQCGRCKQMFTVLQKYLRHKAGKCCSLFKNKAASPTEASESQSDSRQTGKHDLAPKTFEAALEVNHFLNSAKRKHDRKGRVRRIPSMSEVLTPSPTAPVTPPTLLHQEDQQPYRVTPDFHTSGESTINGLPGDRASSPDSCNSQRSNSLSPLYCRPTTYNSVSRGTSTSNPESVPRNQASPVYQVPQPLSHPPPLLNGPVPSRLNQPWNASPLATAARAGEGGASLPLLLPRAVADINKIPMRPIDGPIKELKERGARPFECEICYRRFTQAVDLKRHLLRHSGQKPHVCHFCGKQYTRADRLKVHLASHTDPGNSTTKPYICSRCSKGFDEANQLQTHTCGPNEGDPLLWKANDTERTLVGDREKLELPLSPSRELSLGSNVPTGLALQESVIVPRLSTMKNESLAQMTSAENPVKPFKCEDCNASFTKSTSLKSHSLKHSGEKKYKCEHCAKTFFSSSSLKIHVRVHTGDRPFKCKECPRKFSDPSNFNKHKRWHAKQKGFGVPVRTSQGQEDRNIKRRKPTPAESTPSQAPVYGNRSSVIKKEVGLNREPNETLFHPSTGGSNIVSVFGSRADTSNTETATNREPNENLFSVAEDKEADEDGVPSGFAAPEALVSMDTFESSRLNNSEGTKLD